MIGAVSTSTTPDDPGTTVDRARYRRSDLLVAMRELEDKVARSSVQVEPWAEEVRFAFGGTRFALQAHIDEVEAPGGLLPEVLAETPRLTAAVDELINEHGELIEACERVSRALEAQPLDPEVVRRRVIGLLGRLTIHRQKGADLVYDAYNVDIGGRG
jgi:hypothetical protein